ADLGGGEEHHLGPLPLEKLAHRALLEEVELGVGAQDQASVALRLELAHQCGAGEAAVPGDVDARVGPHPYSCRSVTLWPWRRARSSRSAIETSSRTISATSSAKLTFGFQPSFARALLASPSSVSTSVGRR